MGPQLTEVDCLGQMSINQYLSVEGSGSLLGKEEGYDVLHSILAGNTPNK